MIVQSTRIARKGGYHRLEKHLLDKLEENERVQILSGDRGVFADAQALADAKKCKYALRHLSISPERQMSPKQLAEFVQSIDLEFGIGDRRPRIVVLHQKDDRVHFHLAISEIDPATGRVLDSRHDYARLERLARKYEAANDERLQMSRRDRAVEKVEGFSSKARQKAERVAGGFDRTQLKRASAKGAPELQNELQRQGLFVAHGDKGLILVTKNGDFVAAAHRATGMKKNEFGEYWESFHNDTYRKIINGHVAGHSPDSARKHGSCRQRPWRNRQVELAFEFNPAASNTADRSSPRSLRTRRADYPPVAHRWAHKTLLQQSLATVDLDELLRWAEELTASLMKIILGPRQLLSARIHEARSGAISNASVNNSNGPMLRP